MGRGDEQAREGLGRNEAAGDINKEGAIGREEERKGKPRDAGRGIAQGPTQYTGVSGREGGSGGVGWWTGETPPPEEQNKRHRMKSIHKKPIGISVNRNRATTAINRKALPRLHWGKNRDPSTMLWLLL